MEGQEGLDGLWKRTVHPLNPYLPLILANVVVGGHMYFKQLLMVVSGWEQFKIL